MKNFIHQYFDNDDCKIWFSSTKKNKFFLFFFYWMFILFNFSDFQWSTTTTTTNSFIHSSMSLYPMPPLTPPLNEWKGKKNCFLYLSLPGENKIHSIHLWHAAYSFTFFFFFFIITNDDKSQVKFFFPSISYINTLSARWWHYVVMHFFVCVGVMDSVYIILMKR